MSDNAQPKREILPIPDVPPAGLTTYDAKDPDTAFPPISPLRPPEGADTTRLIVGCALIAIGTILLLNLSIPALGKYFWPLALIAVGESLASDVLIDAESASSSMRRSGAPILPSSLALYVWSQL